MLLLRKKFRLIHRLLFKIFSYAKFIREFSISFLCRDFRAKNLPFSVTDIDRSKKVTRIRPSVYDARYLRTTNLSEGSLSMKVSDPQSYVKHGLLHDGQQLNGQHGFSKMQFVIIRNLLLNVGDDYLVLQ